VAYTSLFSVIGARNNGESEAWREYQECYTKGSLLVVASNVEARRSLTLAAAFGWLNNNLVFRNTGIAEHLVMELGINF